MSEWDILCSFCHLIYNYNWSTCSLTTQFVLFRKFLKTYILFANYKFINSKSMGSLFLSIYLFAKCWYCFVFSLKTHRWPGGSGARIYIYATKRKSQNPLCMFQCHISQLCTSRCVRIKCVMLLNIRNMTV